MSTLQVDSVAGRLGGTSTDLMEGVSVARGRYIQITLSVMNSYNTSSISDDGTGLWTVNLTNPFTASETITVSGICTTDNASGVGFFGIYVQGTSKSDTTRYAAGAVSFESFFTSDTAKGRFDYQVNYELKGDLA